MKSHELKLVLCFFLIDIILFRPMPTFQSPAPLGNMLVRDTFLMNFSIFLKLLQASQASIPWAMLHGLLNHSAVFICSACHSFTSAWIFYVRNPRHLYWQMRVQLVSGLTGHMWGWVTRKQWMLAEILGVTLLHLMYELLHLAFIIFHPNFDLLHLIYDLLYPIFMSW